MRKPDFCLCENKGADQLRGNREADQRLCFRYSHSTIPLLLKSEISSLWLFSVLVQVGLCRTWSETQIVGFVTHSLKCEHVILLIIFLVTYIFVLLQTFFDIEIQICQVMERSLPLKTNALINAYIFLNSVEYCLRHLLCITRVMG